MIALVFSLPLQAVAAPASFDYEHLAALESAYRPMVSPDGSHVAYQVSTPRHLGTAGDGPARGTLYIAPLAAAEPGRPYITRDGGVRQAKFSPDGRYITFLDAGTHDEGNSLWAIPVRGGEAREILYIPGGISAYDVHPDLSSVALIGQGTRDEAWETARASGYMEEVFEEDVHPNKLWVAQVPTWTPVPNAMEPPQTVELDSPLPLLGSPSQASWTPDGASLAVVTSPRRLIDDIYMSSTLQLIDPTSGSVHYTAPNEGKMGAWAVSPSSKQLAMIGSAGPYDPAPGRLMVGSLDSPQTRDLLPSLEGHVSQFVWEDDEHILFLASVGVENQLGRVTVESGDVEVLQTSAGSEQQPLFMSLHTVPGAGHIVLTGQTPHHPSELYTRASDGVITRRTHLNTWLENTALAEQRVYEWKARDGLRLQGLLMTPSTPGPHPLLLMVHGGPESHDRNGWLTNYSRPGQVAVSHGFAVLYPNYRGSTGRGSAFSRRSQGDPAGREFDDLVDAIRALSRDGVADATRVGITGGSYGGYATAWGATRLTKHFRAGVMFVGVTNLVSKGLTTDAPVENVAVHLRSEPWTRQTWRLTRSPVAYVEQARTPLLIAGGTGDTRVHPSESLQLYRALQMIGETPVRYVRYPGEGHGNRHAAARDDYTRRLIRWMEHFILEDQQELPPRALEPSGTTLRDAPEASE